MSYQDKIYKFIQIHLAGEWNPNEVEETSIFQEFQGLVENVTITISGFSNDSELEGKTISIQVDGEANPRILITDSNGQVKTSIRKGLSYDIYPQTYGDYIVQNYLNVKASLSERYINIPYQLIPLETCTLEINIIASGGGNISDFIGSTLTISPSNQQQAIGAVIDNNGKAIFTNLTKYTTYTIISTSLNSNNNTTYRKPANSTIMTSLSVNSVNLEYTKTDIGLFLVNGNDWSETEITQEFIDTLDPTDTTLKSIYIAIHVCPKVLLDSGNDYYVRCRDLTSERLATEVTTKQWGTSNILFPNISTIINVNVAKLDYNGRKNTYYMIYDSVNLGISSPAADFATSQRLNGMPGFIGTVGQMDIIYENTGNRDLIVSALAKLGYSNINFNSATTWSSSQMSATGSWEWFSGGWWGHGSYVSKTLNNLVVPFFSVL